MFLFSDASVRLYCHFLHIHLENLSTLKNKKNSRHKCFRFCSSFFFICTFLHAVLNYTQYTISWKTPVHKQNKKNKIKSLRSQTSRGYSISPFCPQGQRSVRALHLFPSLLNSSVLMCFQRTYLSSLNTWESQRGVSIPSHTLKLLNNSLESYRGRLLACAALSSGYWLHGFPTPSLGLRLSDSEIKLSVGLRVGIFSSHTCICGSEVQIDGHHGLT